MKGKFIVIYGINNLGKTTQAKLLVNRLNKNGYPAEYVKYPLYGLPPAGPLINDYLRNGNPYGFTPREAQLLHYIDRVTFEKELLCTLEKGVNVVAEDYFGTALAWGMGNGVEPKLLKYFYDFVHREDLCFLFDGDRFVQSIEKNHKNENDSRLMEKVRRVHYELGIEYGWLLVNANSPIDDIHEKLWSETEKLLTGKTEESADAGDKVQTEPDGNLIIERISPFAKIPTRAYSKDAGLDLYAADCVSLSPRKHELVKTGIKMRIPGGYAGLVWDKSGIARDGIHAMAGVVDSGYRGEIIVNLINLSGDIYHIAPGQKIAQLLIQKVESPMIIEGPVEVDSERKDKGFGSSGKF